MDLADLRLFTSVAAGAVGADESEEDPYPMGGRLEILNALIRKADFDSDRCRTAIEDDPMA